MTKERLAALDAAIGYFETQCGSVLKPFSKAVEMHAALLALRDAEAKLVGSHVTPEAYETVCQRNSEWLGWARDTLGSEAGELTGGNGLRRALDRKIRRLERELVELKKERDDLGGLVRTWRKWAEALCPILPTRDARSEIARLVELGRRAEAELGEWNEWAAEVTREPGSRPQEFRDVIGDLVELGRKSENTEAKLRVCSEQFDAAMSDWGRAAELLGRIVKCADEDKVQTPGFTRLARAIEEAREMLRPAVPVKEPEVGELETLLTALMGVAGTGPWSWGSRWDEERLSYFVRPDDGMLRAVFGPAEALAAINARLAELAPDGWKLELVIPRPGAEQLKVSNATHVSVWRVNADLGARITEALVWIAGREKPAEPASDEPIKPPGKWVERIKHDSDPVFGRDYTRLAWTDKLSAFEAWKWMGPGPEEVRMFVDVRLGLEEFKELSALFLQRVEQAFGKEGAR